MLANIFGWHDDSVVVVKGRWVTECVGQQYNVYGAATGRRERTVTKGEKRVRLLLSRSQKSPQQPPPLIFRGTHLQPLYAYDDDIIQ